MPWVEPPELPWTAEARATGAVVHVVATLAPAERPDVVYREVLGDRVPLAREAVRERRADELALVPAAFGWALPGEIAAALGERWDGRFEVGRWAPRGRHRLANALDEGGRIDPVLATLAVSDAAVLVSWVESLDGSPISTEVMPGEVVRTEVGPVIADLFAEPYRVRLRVGAALVAPDGDVLVRVTDEFEAVLTDDDGPERVGRTVARAFAGEIAKIWPADPAFAGDELVAAR